MSKWKPARMGKWDGLLMQIPKIIPGWSAQTYAYAIGAAVGALPMALSEDTKQAGNIAAYAIGAVALDWLVFGSEGGLVASGGGLHIRLVAGIAGGALGTYLVKNILRSV